MNAKYEDMLDLPHHRSERHPQMSMHDRAAQFSPFAALTGHGAAVAEAERLTERFREPDENQKALLDEKLWMLQSMQKQRPQIKVLHFLPDERKEGGAYVETEGRFLRVDTLRREVVLESGEAIPVDQIREIDLMDGEFGTDEEF